MRFVHRLAAVALPILCQALPSLALPALAQQATAAPEASAQGQQLFRSRCGTCHGIEPGQNRIGPNLAGVFGREAGKVAGARYSPALLKSGVTWNTETLDGFLANPRQVIAGTTMMFTLRDAAQRSAIIAYLQTLPATGAAR
jgi:cytochrome c